MKYISTRTKDKNISFNLSHAITQGLANDGGLYVPETWPQWNPTHFENLANLSFADFTEKLLKEFFKDDPLEKNLNQICQKAFDFKLPLVAHKLSNSQTTHFLELFHGPTLAFKDFGARFLALCSEEIDNNSNKKNSLVLVATSGDTGGAVASAFCTLTKTPVVILYPHNRISKRQEKQLCTWGEQVLAIAVESNFDDCQNLVKQSFLSNEIQKDYNLWSANSINLGRLLPQMSYFAYTALKYYNSTGTKPKFVIPSGNIGNAVGAFWAHKLGFPIEQIILAHNANHAVPDLFQTGIYTPHQSIATLANAMDVGAPSNLERVLNLYPALEDLKKISSAYSVSDTEITQSILDYYKESMLICPHTAVAAHIVRKHNIQNAIVVATAHPAKFEEIIENLIHKKVDIPDNLKNILNHKSHNILLNEISLHSLWIHISEFMRSKNF